jgi:photosystem II stability/assembly factor-like uncharacterized protein
MKDPVLKHSIWVKVLNFIFPLLIFFPIIYSIYSTFTLKLNKIFFIDEKNGWVIGSKGAILNTRNGGLSWTEQISGTKKGLIGMKFLDLNNGWIVGEEELMLHTENGGNTWKSNKDISELSFTNKIINYIIPLNFKGADLFDVHFIDKDNGWAAGGITGEYIKILHTSDGGKTWETQEKTLSGETLKELETVCSVVKFTDRENGWAIGLEGILLHTTDGGEKWNYHKDITSKTIFGMDLKDNHGWFVGSDGTILHTPDGGKTWETQESGTKDFLYDVFFTDAQYGWIIGDDGHILHTEDGGKKWEIFDTGITKDLISIYFIDHKKGWASGDKKSIFHTTDGGKTWTEQI